ncbi:MAG: S9 family peptidase, partial [Terriglobales bacterium]
MPLPPSATRQPGDDPYAWLRERDNPEVLAYLEAENAYTAEATAGLRELEDGLYREMLGRIQQTDVTVPVRRGSCFYYTRTEEGLQYPVHCRRRGEDGAEQVLLDLNLMAEGLAFLGLGVFEVSDDARWLAYATDTTGMRRYRLQIKDLDRGTLLAPSAERVTSAAWAADSRTLFYTTEDETTKRSDRLWRLEAASGAVTEVFHEPDELYHIGLERTRDRRYLLLGIAATDSTEYRYWRTDEPLAAPQVFLPRRRDHKYDLDHREGRFYIRTNQDAKNFRVLTVPAEDPRWERGEEFLPHRPEVLLEGLELFKTHAVAYEKVEGLERLRVFDYATGGWRAIPFPESVYAAFPGANPEFDTTFYRYNYQSLVTPPSVLDFDLETSQSTLRKQQPVLGGYDPAEYGSERLWATAPDGTRVPISLVYRKPRAPGQPGALLLYGYGAYGYGLPATFSIARLSLLDRGVAYAIAHVRGGNELGEAWHDGGMLMNKKNTFFDFIACAEHLIAAGWTEPRQLAIAGGSAGGLLIGAVLNYRPELFRAAHLAVPFVDVMNTMLDPTLPLTVGEYMEWGDPRQADAEAYMRSYSPYDNLHPAPYPAMLVTTSLNDSQVMYWEPAKYVAKLRTATTRARSAQGASKLPRSEPGATQLLLKTNLGAGHGGASGRYDRLREIAFEYAWLLGVL